MSVSRYTWKTSGWPYSSGPSRTSARRWFGASGGRWQTRSRIGRRWRMGGTAGSRGSGMADHRMFWSSSASVTILRALSSSRSSSLEWRRPVAPNAGPLSFLLISIVSHFCITLLHYTFSRAARPSTTTARRAPIHGESSGRWAIGTTSPRSSAPSSGGGRTPR